MVCPNCNTENRATAHYCLRCGWWLASNCPFCGVELLTGVFFCDRCGRQLAASLNPPGIQAQILSSNSDYREQSQATVAQNNRSPIVSNETTLPNETIQSLPLEPAAEDQSLLHRYVPTELLEKLQTARAKGEMVGERKVVTMLFCDVKGSTETAGQLDPEDWSEIINDTFEYMIRPIYHYEGTIARLMGDGILAFFGAPIAHEDDPRRAVLAGLDIQAGISSFQAQVKDRWGKELSVRIGVNTGLVVVGAVGSDLHLEYSALGDAINIAARMEQTATPGTVQISLDTYRLVKPYFEFYELGSIDVKGKSEPVIAYQVVSPRSEPGSLRGIAGLNSALVGRTREMSMLQEVLTDLAQGVGRVVFISGEAGLGKSRLIDETRRLFNELIGPKGKWITANGLSYETNQAYSLFRMLTERIVRSDSPALVTSEAMAAKLLEGTPEASDEQAQYVMEYFLGLNSDEVSGNLNGETFKQVLYQTMKSAWQHLFASAPAILVCDDLHWVDGASIRLLESLFSLVDEIPIVLVFACRPERLSAGWQLKISASENYHHRFTDISLAPFTEAESDEFIDRLLSNPDLPVHLRQRILERTAGNPFFIEEILRSLIDNGSLVLDNRVIENGTQGTWRAVRSDAPIEIPDNLQSLLAARIDRLDDGTRQTIQFASVVGRSFYKKILAALESSSKQSEEALNQQIKALIRMEIWQEAARIPNLEYRFRNPLTQEVAYRAILLKRRRELHRMVGEAYEQQFPERLVEFSTRISHHYLEAQEFDRALKYLIISADASFRLYALPEAIEQYTRAIEFIPSSDVSPEQVKYLYLRRGRSFELNSQFEEALANYAEMERVAVDKQDRAMELAAVTAQATIYSTANVLFSFEKADIYSQRGLELARALNDGPAEAKIQWNLLNRYRFSDDISLALEAGNRSLELARSLNLREQLAFTLNDIYWAYMASGQLAKAKISLSEARELWRELGNRAMLVDNIASMISLSTFSGDLDTAIQDSKEAFELAKSINNLWGMSFSQMFIGTAFWVRGEFNHAIQSAQTCIEYANLSGFIVGKYYGSFEMALIYSFLGQGERGLALIQPLVKFDLRTSTQAAQWFSYLCRIYLELGKIDEVEALVGTDFDRLRNDSILKFLYDWVWNDLLLARCNYKEVIDSTHKTQEILEEIQVALFIPDVLSTRAKAYLALGQTAEARQALLDAKDRAESMRLDWFIWQILDTLTKVELQDKQIEKAEGYRAEACKTIQDIADRIGDQDLKDSFFMRPDVHSILEADLR